MTKIDFQNKKTDLFGISNFVRRNNLEHINILDQAFEQNALVENNKNFLSNFSRSNSSTSLKSFPKNCF